MDMRDGALELQTKVHTKVHNHREVLFRAFSWLKVPNSVFTFKCESTFNQEKALVASRGLLQDKI